MASFTSRMGLRKPAPGEKVDVSTDINDSMDKIDLNMGYVIGTSTTRPGPGARFPGQQIYDTDTHKLYFWDGTTWVLLEKVNEVEFYQATSFTTVTVTIGALLATISAVTAKPYRRRFHIRATVTVGGTTSGRQTGDIVVSYPSENNASTLTGSKRSRHDTANLGGDYTQTHVIDFSGTIAANETPLVRLWWNRAIGMAPLDIQPPGAFSSFDATLWPY